MAKNKHQDKHDAKDNTLNDAVEHNATPDESTDEHRAQDRQNQQSTMASTTATGAESADQNTQANMVSDDGAGAAKQSGRSGQRRAQESQSKDEDPSGPRSGDNQGETPALDNGREGEEIGGGGGVGAQAVGGGSSRGERARSDESSAEQNQASQQGADQLSGAGGGVSPATAESKAEDFDTATTSETFQVDVANAQTKELAVEDDFDTETVSQTFEIQVENVNDAAVVTDTLIEGTEDTSITFTQEMLLENATDIDSDQLTAVNLSIDPAFGDVVDNKDGTFTFTPADDYNGEVPFTFDVDDNDGAVTPAAGKVDLAAVNDAATVSETVIEGDEDNTVHFTQAMLLQNASDVDSTNLTALNLQIDEQYGSLVDNKDGTFTFTPTEDYNGDVPFTFDVDDNDGAVTSATGNVNLAAVNDAPVLAETSYLVNEDGSIKITEASLIDNATDVDGDALSVVKITADENGHIEQNLDGDWIYTPNPDYSGDANLTIVINDGTVDAEFTAPVTITPDADEPSLTVSLTDMTLVEYGQGYDSALTGWHTDNANNAIEIHQDYVYGVGDNRGGVIELEANRGDESNLYTTLDVKEGDVVTLEFDMSARLHYEGTDSQVDVYFEGQLVDTLIEDDAGWHHHSYQFTATEDNPRLEFDSPDDNSLGGLLDAISIEKVISEDQAVPINLDASLTDTDGSESLQSLVIDGLPDGATLTDGVNTFTASEDGDSTDVAGWDVSQLIFQGAEHFNGDVALTISATSVESSTLQTDSPETATTTTTLDFHVTAVNDPVVIDENSPLQFNTLEDSEIIITEAALLANASDADGDNLMVTNLQVDNASFKTVIDSETGDKSFVVMPNTDVNGDLSIRFNVSDDNGSVVSSDASLVVAAVNDAAKVDDQAFTMNEDGSLTFTDKDLLAGATDVDGDDLTVESVNYNGADGVFTDHGNGSYTFAPNENFNGEVDLSFAVNDGTISTPANIDITVDAVNDIPVAGTTTYSVDEDGILTFNDKQLLANSSDVEGGVSIADVSYSGEDGILTNHGDGSYSFAPNANFDGDVAIDVTVKDEEGATATTTANVDVLAINDSPVVSSNVAYSVDEDGSITLSQAQLLMHTTDIDSSETLVAENLQLEAFGQVTANEDGSFTIVPAENFNGDLDLTFDVTDGEYTVSTGLDLTVNPVNDPVVAKDDDRLDGSDPMIRLDAAPEHGSVQYQTEEGDWADMVVGIEYPAGTQVQFTPNTEEIQADTRDIRIGSFDSNTDTNVFDGKAKVEDWGTVDGDTAVYQEDGVTVTTQVNTGELAAWNGAGSHVGAGIGNESRQGLDTNELLTVTVEGEDVNQITFQLDGLGGYFDETSRHATEVMIKAYDSDGNIIDAQGGYRESGEYQDEYVFTTDVPVHHFTLGTTGSNGTYVVQNMTVSRTMSEEIQMTTIQPDGSEVTHAMNLDLNYSTADQTLDVTDQLVEVKEGIHSRAIEVEEDGQLVIDPADLLLNDTDVDGDTLTIVGVEATDDTHGKVHLDEDGNVVFTPEPDYNGPASFTYTVSDGNGSTDTATVSVDVTPVEDEPVAPNLSFNVDEDQVLVIDPAYILKQASDADGDKLTLEDLSLKQPPNGQLQLQQDGMYHLITPPDFNGLIELNYTVSDGDDKTEGAMKVDVLPVNDAPFSSGNAHLTTHEDGAFTFNANDMLDLFGDIDGDDLVISRIITAEGEDGGKVEQNEDGSWTFTPAEDYSGTAELQVEVKDPDGLTTMLEMPVYVRPVADGAVITTDHQGPLVFDEDSSGLLGLNVEMIDASEQLSHLVITGFPVGFEVSDGVNTITITEENQVLDVTTWSMDDLSLTPPQDFTGSFFITVSATTADYGEESSSQVSQPTESYADFDATAGDTLVLSMDDLLAMADGIETSKGDEVEGVHLIDRSQGELVDNNDGTWSFTPAEGFTGDVDFAYQVINDGNTIDVQSTIAVADQKEATPSKGEEEKGTSNESPRVDSIATTDLDAGNTLTFDDRDLLAQLSDANGDTLSIESVQLISGQGILETKGEGEYSFSPAEGFNGEAKIAFVASDGQESIRSHFNVNVAEPESSFMLNEQGALELSSSDILTSLGLDGSLDVAAVDYHGEAGTLIEDGEGGWMFWTDEEFDGNLELDVTTSDGESKTQHDLTLTVDEYRDPDAAPEVSLSTEPEAKDVDTQTQTAEGDQAEGGAEDSQSEDADLNAAPGGTVRVDIPDEVADNPDVDQVEISNLPEGATISNGIMNDDGSYTVSGDLSRPVTMTLSDEHEGTTTINFEGQTDIGEPVDGATGEIVIDVDDAHAMQSGERAQDNPQGMPGEDSQDGDWTQGDNRDGGIDVMDDSSSYDNDDHSAQQDDHSLVDDNV
nr:tandem-95 repeat protein [Photobacterium sanguinicancri]